MMSSSRKDRRFKVAVPLFNYLTLVLDSKGPPELVVITSSLRIELLVRLLTYLPVCADKFEVIGQADIEPYSGRELPSHLGVRLGLFVEPKWFTSDRTGELWALLSRDDASCLHQDWMMDPRYHEVVADNKNYFKNQVDTFGKVMEGRWSQQQK